jgi:phosphatidylglycerophosphatase C
VATVVFFDVDGTVTLRDSLRPFLQRVAPTWPSFCWSALRAGVDALVHARFSRGGAKESLVARVLAGADRHELQDIGRCLAQEMVAGGWLREDAMDAIALHKAAGAKVVFVSASLDVYLEPLRELLAVDGLLCTGVAFDVLHRATGRFVGDNVRSTRKVALSEAWLADNGLEREACEVIAYGNSGGDAALLAWADHGYLRSRRFLRRTGAFAS